MPGYPKPILPGIFCSLASFVLLLLVTISTPLYGRIYFLKLLTGPNETEPFPSNEIITFGVFGRTNGACQVGYLPADWSGTGVMDPTVNQAGLHGITYALVLHPITAFLSALTFGCVVVGLHSRTGAVIGTLSSGIMSTVILVIFIIDVVLFSVLKRELVQAPYNDRHTSYGPAIWMTLAALIASLITVASVSFTAFSHGIYPRKWANEEMY